jgi:DNA adenine methylase
MVGGGALFFALAPKDSVLIDLNAELIETYTVVRDKVDELIADLFKYKDDVTYYYTVREMDPSVLSPVERASRFIFLNKTCYNGLYRVNSNGKFNVPYGKHRNLDIVNADGLRSASLVLKNATLYQGDFSRMREFAQPGDFFYIDPPYQPLNNTSRFTNYTSSNFGTDDQTRLALLCKELSDLGCKFVLSNSDTPLVRELYKEFRIEKVYARRVINSKGERRGPIPELVVMNY